MIDRCLLWRMWRVCIFPYRLTWHKSCFFERSSLQIRLQTKPNSGVYAQLPLLISWLRHYRWNWCGASDVATSNQATHHTSCHIFGLHKWVMRIKTLMGTDTTTICLSVCLFKGVKKEICQYITWNISASFRMFQDLFRSLFLYCSSIFRDTGTGSWNELISTGNCKTLSPWFHKLRLLGLKYDQISEATSFELSRAEFPPLLTLLSQFRSLSVAVNSSPLTDSPYIQHGSLQPKIPDSPPPPLHSPSLNTTAQCVLCERQVHANWMRARLPFLQSN